ncbi:hypothetical protein SERLA73DRAFT_183405 [Serpula lacrymans var. lacrymans S7.3]|uniref:Uncharacterized protein n=2 Tax=Serpula lacrymans var. lacrymans TaxID=341189 RepID=F8PZT8_SERL3|nr:uncharacterized protein SERLADRAFT_470506 [Serpula lacrymans var. lacrymans S7.9]EGN98410.1 hypothetical protein SERLA73DRAFT_183405 [Serpula lacrymans var. lacrymans S7.3]EGO23962.1 hypothetical protein SERLADRAFT_470506 [Serpula lacrymans var. lacrymans S7.9]
MAVINGSTEQGLLDILDVIMELSDQLTQHRSESIALHSMAGAAKTQAVHSQTGFVLRRFNLDKSKEAYESELECMNASLSAENHDLQHDNKQLNSLIKEYEQTLENVMSAFRNRARDVQEHELALIRDYESKLLSREFEDATRDLGVSTSQSESLARLSTSLRQLMRSLNGEEARPIIEEAENSVEPVPEDDFALERECELARLEKENQVLRRMLGEDVQDAFHYEAKQIELPKMTPSVAGKKKGMLGGAPGTVGPFGTYKRLHPAT